MSCYRAWIALAIVSGTTFTGFTYPAAFAKEEPAQVAAKADEILASELNLGSASTKPAPMADDEIFLRRVTLDLQGRLPSAAEITTFALDPATDKRQTIVRKLLADRRYGENWSKYWRDVIMYRATEQRAQIVAGVLTDYLRESINENKPWSQVATDFITAEGDGLTKGETALIIAQEGKPEETVAEISRIFLGVQIQCAQCHDHPTDRWKREQFHELAAFFPRVSSRIILTPDNRTISVAVTEFGNEPFERNGNRVRGSAEHRMSDLQKPDAPGRMMKPILFATGDSVPVTTRDSQRRGQLAEFITKPENPYFAKALVNRLWSELVGEGFYEPVDDMGPDRDCFAPKTLEHLSTAFAATGYDVKWLFETITATQAYQRASRSRRNPEQVAFVANVPQRLRADQLFENVLTALGTREPAAMAGPGYGGGVRFGRGPRQAFAAVFGYDPSERRDEVAGTIPQALVMMNSPYFNGLLDGRSGRTALGKMLSEIQDDRALIGELYLRTLAREPSLQEVNTCLAHVADVKNRTEAFEDIHWSLLNSTEFLYRR
ncbi:hypothetical protein ETAA8_10150 [Anatilimnocola aggregata]|uniref:DUF1549 domain-containing protein n=1 Tax=Anatilimnocola aggregata TaxID=2528021 RepID=A0A517Y6T6_9BACT|nr:DUF1549 domain-containing protein [Anatilimnocola aggregata]QDU25943.1 hypothetical protein ETAA8_10150 [Anatilimnocola aggregata]